MKNPPASSSSPSDFNIGVPPMIVFEKPTPSMKKETNHCVLPIVYADNIEKSIKQGQQQFVTPPPHEQRQQVSVNDNDRLRPVSERHEPHCRVQNHPQVEPAARHPSHPRDSKHLRMLHAYKRSVQRADFSSSSSSSLLSEVQTPSSNNARRRDDNHDYATRRRNTNTTQQLEQNTSTSNTTTTTTTTTQLVRRDSKHLRMVEIHVPELFQIPNDIVPCDTFDAGTRNEIINDGGQQLPYTYIISPLDVICTNTRPTQRTRHPGNLFFDYLIKTNIETLLNQRELPELVDALAAARTIFDTIRKRDGQFIYRDTSGANAVFWKIPDSRMVQKIYEMISKKASYKNHRAVSSLIQSTRTTNGFDESSSSWEQNLKHHSPADVRKWAVLSDKPAKPGKWSKKTIDSAVKLLAMPPFPTQVDMVNLRKPSAADIAAMSKRNSASPAGRHSAAHEATAFETRFQSDMVRPDQIGSLNWTPHDQERMESALFMDLDGRRPNIPYSISVPTIQRERASNINVDDARSDIDMDHWDHSFDDADFEPIPYVPYSHDGPYYEDEDHEAMIRGLPPKIRMKKRKRRANSLPVPTNGKNHNDEGREQQRKRLSTSY